jgi:hypothetical protein
MAVINYSKTNRFYQTPQASWFLGIYVDRGLVRDGSDVPTMLLSRHNFRPDLLSFDLYGIVDYRWTFLILNPDLIKDPIFDFVTGLSIFTATLDRLHSSIGA